MHKPELQLGSFDCKTEILATANRLEMACGSFELTGGRVIACITLLRRSVLCCYVTVETNGHKSRTYGALSDVGLNGKRGA